MGEFTFSFNTRVYLNVTGRIQKNIQAAQHILDQQVIKDSNYYIPLDTGMLRDSALNASKVGEGRLYWNTPYARKLYYNPQYKFSKDKNPNARGLWFEAAKSVHIKDWLKMAQDAFTQ